MKKNLKKVICFVLVFAMSFSMTTTVFAAHPNPIRPGELCYAPEKYATKTGLYTSRITGSHLWQNVINCSITQFVYFHTIRCWSCNAVLRTGVLGGCQTTHSRCGESQTVPCPL